MTQNCFVSRALGRGRRKTSRSFNLRQGKKHSNQQIPDKSFIMSGSSSGHVSDRTARGHGRKKTCRFSARLQLIYRATMNYLQQIVIMNYLRYLLNGQNG